MDAGKVPAVRLGRKFFIATEVVQGLIRMPAANLRAARYVAAYNAAYETD